MITKVYFVRHAQPDFSVKDDRLRPLTERGLQASLKVTHAFEGHKLDRIFSSPYKRAYDTVLDLSRQRNLAIKTIEDFRERRVDSVWIDNFQEFSKKQWMDFDYKLNEGESLREVQQRNIAALKSLLIQHPGQSIAIGTHGTAMSTIFNHFNPKFGFNEFWSIVDKMPYISCLQFNGQEYVGDHSIEIPMT